MLFCGRSFQLHSISPIFSQELFRFLLGTFYHCTEHAEPTISADNKALLSETEPSHLNPNSTLFDKSLVVDVLTMKFHL